MNKIEFEKIIHKYNIKFIYKKNIHNNYKKWAVNKLSMYINNIEIGYITTSNLPENEWYSYKNIKYNQWIDNYGYSSNYKKELNNIFSFSVNKPIIDFVHIYNLKEIREENNNFNLTKHYKGKGFSKILYIKMALLCNAEGLSLYQGSTNKESIKVWNSFINNNFKFLEYEIEPYKKNKRYFLNLTNFSY